ncbi:B12-binding domain-containing radical SAM protein, partial [Myxococcota bacterium]|nr:B12-binding domain-containing radical SAM protein [Myxococcota bacterium]
FRDHVLKYSPKLIAFSVTEDLFPMAANLVGAIADLNIQTIFGGVFPTFAPEKCLALDGVHMVCIGEGEKPLSELCRHMDSGKNSSTVSGIWFKTTHGTIKNPVGPPVDINQNPVLDFSLFTETRFYRPMQGKVWRMLPVETHRGCPYQCTYCNSPSQKRLYWDKTRHPFYRKKTARAIHEEMLYFVNDLKAEAFYFWADTFLSYTDKEFDEFCEMYTDIRLPFWMQSRPETINTEKIQRLMTLGLFRMGLGVEHGNEVFRKLVLKRNVSNRTIIENLNKLKALDLPFSVNNIIGFPGDTHSLSMETVEINRHIPADNANAYSFSPFHGTPLRTIAEQKGYCDKELIARSVTRPTMLNMPEFPPEQIEGLRRCFNLYVRMPKSRWPEIELAEKLTPDGDRTWNALRNECAEMIL